MAVTGLTHELIAAVLDVAPKTLRKHFRAELDYGVERANANVIANLYRQATKDDFKAIPAAIFWAKTRLGWREKAEIEHSGDMTIQIGQEFDGL